MVLVAGVDSSTQSCKVVIRDAETGQLVRSGHAAHPAGTEVNPEAWWTAFLQAASHAGGLNDIKAIGIAGQQHGMVCLDKYGDAVRPALLWNDTRSASDAERIVAALSPSTWAERVGSVPVASFTITKLAWLARHEPDLWSRTAAVCLPHDWLTWKLRGGGYASETFSRVPLTTDRGDASGTGYWSPVSGQYQLDLLHEATGRSNLLLPTVLGPADIAGETSKGIEGLPAGKIVSAGTGDNMAAALALDARIGDVIISVGTSGVVSAVSEHPTSDPTGLVAGFADATGAYLPLACTLNAARVIDTIRTLLSVSYTEYDALAASYFAQSNDAITPLTMLPYFEGERTPNRPLATGVLSGITNDNMTREGLAAAAIDAVACSLADGCEAITSLGVPMERLLIIGGGARSQVLQQRVAAIVGRPVVVPTPGEYVADGAALQAAWALTGQRPDWTKTNWSTVSANPDPRAVERYRHLRNATGPDAWPP